MKKILTLFVMFLCGWSIVSAQTQTPAFGYQAVVRNADNVLMADTDVTVTIYVMSNGEELYSETHETRTDGLGMLNILVGTQSTADGVEIFDEIDWSTVDSIKTVVNVAETEFEFKTALRPVPYALQAGNSALTTEQIVNYLSDPTTTIQSYKAIMAALVGNVPTEGELWDMIKARLVQYLKNRKDKAVDVLVDYLTNHADAEDVNTLYANVSGEAKAKAMSLTKQFALENKEYAVELIKAYLPTVNAKDAGDAMTAAIISINTMRQELTHEDSVEIINRAVSFAKNHIDLAVSAVVKAIPHITTSQMNTFLNTIFGDNIPMKQAFVNNLFYNYLDYKLLPDIKVMVDQQLGNTYLQKQRCGADNHEVDFCGMRNVLPTNTNTSTEVNPNPNH